MQVLPSEVHRGYLLTEIHSSPSEYAFATEPSELRIPVQTHSEYQLAALNPWKTATSSSVYHYVSPAELKPIVETGRSIFGNPLSLSALKKRLNLLDSGIYRPVIVDGTLYFVASEVATVTAHASFDSDLKQETKTAIEKLSADVKTGRFPQSPTVSKSEVKLSLKQLRKLLGKKLFNTVLKRCKKAHNNSNLSSSDENRLEGSTAHKSSSVDTAHSFGVLNSCYSTRTAVDPDDVKTAEYGELQIPTTNSLTSVSQKTEIDSGALSFWEKEMAEKYGLTGKENSELHLATALDSDFSMASSASTHANDDLAKNQWDKEMEKKYQTNIEKLEPNQERLTTEVGSGLVFGQTPTSFDQRASFSGRYLGDALDSNRFVSLDGDVNTAEQNSKTNLHENMERFTSKIKELKKKHLVFNENIGKTKDNDNFAVIVYSSKSFPQYAGFNTTLFGITIIVSLFFPSFHFMMVLILFMFILAKENRTFYVWRLVDGEESKVIKCLDKTTAVIKAEMIKEMLEDYESAQKVRKVTVNTVKVMKETFEMIRNNFETNSQRFMKIIDEKEKTIKDLTQMYVYERQNSRAIILDINQKHNKEIYQMKQHLSDNHRESLEWESPYAKRNPGSVSRKEECLIL